MAKVTIREAAKLVKPDESTIYRHVRTGKIASETNPQGKKVIDTAELQRFYGEIKTATPEITNGNHQQIPHPANDEIVALLESKIELLTEQNQDLKKDKDRLMEMLSVEQEKTKMLMLPTPKEEAKPISIWKRIFRYT